jgi:arylsulfatase
MSNGATSDPTRSPIPTSNQKEQPNIVLVLMDNLGWGELGTYGGGILRGAPTPRIDSLADEGLKLLNFNVEAQCTPSRAALMTGRYAIRTGNASVPLGVGAYGLTQWEYTMAEMLSEAGYATAMFGKWHLGDTLGRFPTDQGFDEWFGIPNSSDESYWPDNDLFRPGVHPQVKYEYVMAAKRGQAPRELEVYNSAKRLTIDREITDRAIDYMKRTAGTKPFFLFLPYTQVHLPVEPHPDYKGKTANGHWADVLAQTDAYVGELLGAIDHLGIRDNTIFIFTSDNGPEGAIPHHGFSGPWRGTYFTGLEASLRVPFLIRWPRGIPPKRVSNEIVHQMDLFVTFARIAGGTIPSDRVIDGVDQTDFLTGAAAQSNRESVVIYVGNQLFGVKWRDWKMMVKELNTVAGDPVRSFDVPLFYNLLLDPKEEHPVLHAPPNLWVRFPAGQALVDHAKSLGREPPIPPGTADPYRPSQ